MICHHCFGQGIEPDQRAVGHRLRQLRESKGLALREVAARMKISNTYLSLLETGERIWSFELRAAYLKAINERDR